MPLLLLLLLLSLLFRALRHLQMELLQLLRLLQLTVEIETCAVLRPRVWSGHSTPSGRVAHSHCRSGGPRTLEAAEGTAEERELRQLRGQPWP